MWPGQGWNLTLAVHALNMRKVLEDFDGARAIFEHEYDEAVRAGAPVLMSGLAVAYADVLLRLGRLDEALELVDQTSEVMNRRIQPWADLAAAVLCGRALRPGDRALHRAPSAARTRAGADQRRDLSPPLTSACASSSG